ncbi:maleylpyruvate isomerase N-terminal domain-containing protein [Microbacterium karelineae]|uniref:maleylpyruvate isomerase N-terminal domain-containing protein n=1 Tax=Microbacterium karelineae TaxID=2654283 RepID=UPI0012EAE28E|nr:maleylpyruvate isomerase N-terminal domain-containing protein [Microbacterium karelineae]
MPGRTDDVADPALAADLLLARRGQAFYARVLGDLPDRDLAGPSRVPGFSRARIVAHVALEAREVARVVEAVRTSDDPPSLAAPGARRDEIDFAATLPAEALRNLAAHAAVHLNVEWRDLPADGWRRPIRTAGAAEITPWSTVRHRARELWGRALDLDGVALERDVPPEILGGLPLPNPFTARSL